MKKKVETVSPPFELFVEGIPNGKARPRLGRYAVYSPKSGFEEDVESQARAMMCVRPKGARGPIEGPISAGFTFYFNRPKSTPKKQNWKTTKPDLDNLLKGVQDALERAGVFKNDAQICDTSSRKIFSDKNSGVYIMLKPFEDSET